MNKRLFLLLMLGLCGLFAACGDAPQAEPDSEETRTYSYSMEFRELPDPDAALYESGMLDEHENCQVMERKRVYQDGSIYRYLAFIEEEDSYFDTCLQVFHEDTWAWEQIQIPTAGWMEDRNISVRSMVGATEEGVFLEIADYTAEEKQRYLGFFDGTVGRCLMPWPEDAEDAFVCQDQQGKIYFVDSEKGTIHTFDSKGKSLGTTVLDGFLKEGVINPATGRMIWYGGGRDSLRLWKDIDKSVSYESVSGVSPYETQIACDQAGILYYADAQGLWVQEEQPRQLLSFAQRGYLLEELCSLQVQEDGSLRGYVYMDGGLYLMRLTGEETEETAQDQEIILDGGGDIFLEQIVTRFNLRYPQYHIAFLESGEELRIQTEIAAGQGPDLFTLSSFSAAEYARSGYIRNLEGIVEDSSLFLEAAMECGRINGVTYGIPYGCSIQFPVFSQEIVGNRRSWTVEEMMQVIGESDAEILFWYFSDPNAMAIVTEYGLYDNENTDYIDWAKGESHLAEEPFIRLLEFAGEYADTGEYGTEEVLPMLRDGRIAGAGISLWKLGMLDYAETFFPDGTSYIGYPDSSGERGIYARTQCIYVNQATEQMEGITEFFRFLLSEEAQRLCVADGECYQLPVRLSTISYLIEQEQAKAEKPGEYGMGSISWLEDGLDEGQLKVLQELLDQAKPYKFYAMEIEDILYEELTPYFQGARSAEETVAILDNRVQLYLDERGTDLLY